MRAMEYTPAPPPPDPVHPGLYAEGWEWDEFEDERTRQWVEENTLHDKHLTDTECAAEYWRAEAEHTGMRNGEGVGWSSAEVMGALEREVEVWERFATHPHASEEER